MKKFVGNVNGIIYNDVEEFNKAVSEAIAKKENPMLISSYYEECNDECNCGECCCGKKPKTIEDKKESDFNINNILITKDSKKNYLGEYYLPEINTNDITDKDVAITTLKNSVNANNNNIKDCESKIKGIDKEIKKLNDDIKSLTDKKTQQYITIGDYKAQNRYYNTLIEGISDSDNVDENIAPNDVKPTCEHIKKHINRNTIIYDLLKSFDDYLNDIDFWR